MNHTATRTLLLAAVCTLLALAPLAAQVPSFNAEVDCTGIFAPGNSVPYTIRLENQILENIPLDLTIVLAVPGRGNITLKQRPFTLRANQDVQKGLTLNLPMNAPVSNDYQIIFTASSSTETSFDTCSFKVQ